MQHFKPRPATAACLAAGLIAGTALSQSGYLQGRHYTPAKLWDVDALRSTASSSFFAHAARRKKEPIDPNRNPIDQYVVPVARTPSNVGQNRLFPGIYAAAKYKPPIPTLSSGLSLEEQAAMVESTLAYGLPSIENVVVRKPYVLSYNFRSKNANWVAEHYWRENITQDHVARRDEATFMKDVSIPQIFSQSSGDYLKSGFSRGHLAPAASHNVSQEDMQLTFAFTNIIPQNQVMNETDWLHLEKFCRHLTKHFGNVRVLSGPLYIPTDSTNFTELNIPVIGSNEVWVPSHLFKVIYLQGKEAISHCHLHTTQSGGCDLTPEMLKQSVRFHFPSSLYNKHYKKMFDYITQLPDQSEVKRHLLQSFDWRIRTRYLYEVKENPDAMTDVVVMAFIMKNDVSSHGKSLENYMVKLPYVETLSGLCLTPRQDCDNIMMSTWNQ